MNMKEGLLVSLGSKLQEPEVTKIGPWAPSRTGVGRGQAGPGQARARPGRAGWAEPGRAWRRPG